jgi:hypothetical protein
MGFLLAAAILRQQARRKSELRQAIYGCEIYCGTLGCVNAVKMNLVER